jgi:putative nucleotidyltransferase with HDIG domain
MKFRFDRIPFRVAAFYLLFGGLWILVSDRLLAMLVSDPDLLTRIQTYKGWMFVLASAVVLYLQLFFELQKRQQAEEETRRHLVELEAVNRISIALRTAHTLDEMIPSLLDESLAALEAGAGAIFLYDPDRGSLKCALARGFFVDLPIGETASEEWIAGTVFSTGVPYLSHEFARDPNTNPAFQDLVPDGWGGACIPIRTTFEVVGVLFIAVQLPRRINPPEIHLLSTLAEIAGNAIHRTNLHAQTQRRLQRISALHAIDQAISASLDLNFVLEVLLGQVISQLRVDAAAILLFNAVTLRLDLAASRGFHQRQVLYFSTSLGEGVAGKVALERRRLNIPNLPERKDDFLRGPLFVKEGFQTYFGVPLFAKGKLKGVLEIFNRSPLNPDSEWLGFLDTLAGQAAIAIENATLVDELQDSNFQLGLAYDTTLEGWARALELRDRETEGHTQRVVELTERVARAVGIAENDLVHIRRGTLLHDIGKMGIPDEILLKEGPLEEQEWNVMRQHPVLALNMLRPIAYLGPALDIPYCHHERWDGSGYPRGLKGEEIPLAARIFALVDVWDALTKERPYKPAWPEEAVIEYIRSLSGVHFDPHLTPIFLDLIKDHNGRVA